MAAALHCTVQGRGSQLSLLGSEQSLPDRHAQLVTEALHHELLLLTGEGHHLAPATQPPSASGSMQVLLHAARQAHLQQVRSD